MVYPIIAYGHPILKKKAADISKDYPELEKLIVDMYETMEASHGVGLAAPQIGLSIRLFITDGSAFKEDDDDVKDFKQVFINPVIVEEKGNLWPFNEGCLSIPGVREDVKRKEIVHIKYYDAEWKPRDEKFTGIAARIIQHEYDHIEGVLFVDKISPFRRRIIKNKLLDISKGEVDVDYKMKFAPRK